MNNQVICQAIKERRLLRFYYDTKVRIVEPYCYGRNDKNHELVRAFQVDGYSSSNPPKGWRLFKAEKITSLNVLPESFDKIRADYERRDSEITTIYIQI